uniref:Uncharacterized protein n=1 Tax=Glossina palpalis gambiensis TaxID=67801 RepID=A0A1B0C467_9MUSC
MKALPQPVEISMDKTSFELSRLGNASGEALFSTLLTATFGSSEEFSPDGLCVDLRFLDSHTNSPPHESSSKESSHDLRFLEFPFGSSLTSSGLSSTLSTTFVSSAESSSEDLSHDLRFLEFSFGSSLTSSGLSSTLTTTFISSDESSSEDLSRDLRFLKFSFGSNLTSSGLSSILTTLFLSSVDLSSEDLRVDLRFLEFSFGSNITSSGLSSTLTTTFFSSDESSSEDLSHDLRFLKFSFGSSLTSSGLSSILTTTFFSSDESSSEDLSHDLRFLKFSFGSNLTSSGLSSILTTTFISSDEFSSEDLSNNLTKNVFKPSPCSLEIFFNKCQLMDSSEYNNGKQENSVEGDDINNDEFKENRIQQANSIESKWSPHVQNSTMEKVPNRVIHPPAASCPMLIEDQQCSKSLIEALSERCSTERPSAETKSVNEKVFLFHADGYKLIPYNHYSSFYNRAGCNYAPMQEKKTALGKD